MVKPKLVALSKTLGLIILFLSFMAIFLPFINYSSEKSYVQLNNTDSSFYLLEAQRTSFVYQLNISEMFILGIFIFLFLTGISALMLTDKYERISALLWIVYGVYLFTYWYLFALNLKISSVSIGLIDFDFGRTSGEYFFVSRPSLSFIILLLMSILSIINAIMIFIANSKKVEKPYLKLDQEEGFTTFFTITSVSILVLLPFGLGLLFINTSLLYSVWDEIFGIDPLSTTLIFLICISLWIIFLIKFLSFFKLLEKFSERDNYEYERLYFLIPIFISVFFIIPRDIFNTHINNFSFIIPILIWYFIFIILIYFFTFNIDLIRETTQQLFTSLGLLKKVFEKTKTLESPLLIIFLLITLFPFTPFAMSSKYGYFPDLQYDTLSYQLETTDLSLYDNGTVIIKLNMHLNTTGLFDEIFENQSDFKIRFSACFLTLEDQDTFHRIGIVSVDSLTSSSQIEEEIGFVDIDGKGEEFISWEINFIFSADFIIVLDNALLESGQSISLVFCYPAENGDFNSSFGYTRFIVSFFIVNVLIQAS